MTQESLPPRPEVPVSAVQPNVKDIRRMFLFSFLASVALVAGLIVFGFIAVAQAQNDTDTKRALEQQVELGEYQALITDRNICVGAINSRKDLALISSHVVLGEFLAIGEGNPVPPAIVAEAEQVFEDLKASQSELRKLVRAAEENNQDVSPCPAPDPPDFIGQVLEEQHNQQNLGEQAAALSAVTTARQVLEIKL